MNFNFKYILLLCLLSLFFSFGCVTKKMPPQEKNQPGNEVILQSTEIEEQTIKGTDQKYFIHIVKWDGESMSLIARWYIGKYEDWKLLAKHNPDLNPYNIHVKDRVRIPPKKMKTSKQMPESFLNKYSTKKKTKKVEGKKDKKTIELYGPKEHEKETEE